MSYPFRDIETKWQKIWEETGLHKASEPPRKKYYVLEMFAYPSGDIHLGHFRNYTIGDVVYRHKMMRGYDVLHPFGWDAFGLPAEQAAIKNQVDPESWTLSNIEVSRNTLKKVGIGYDWEREVTTCKPDYYKWNQWLFLKLYEKGLAYRDKSLVNWCPECKTVLANEQVSQGKCWRGHEGVTKRELEQWFFKITVYAEKLLNDLELLKAGWPENVITMQKNWIGKSEGVEIDFTVEKTGEKISVFTTRPDTIYGVTFMAIAPESKLISRLPMDTQYKPAVDVYIQRSFAKTGTERTVTEEKDGVFTGCYAINPLSGEKVQLWVADYVVAAYGTGIVMGVPGHDQRDFTFAKKYRLPIKIVIQPPGKKLTPETMEQAYAEQGTMVNCDIFSGLRSVVGIRKVIEHVEEHNLGRRKTNYKLRDWLVSRQRYWGTPIPFIHCEKCGLVPVPENQLPVLLPKGVIDYLPKGRSPLEDLPEFINTTCPKCNANAKRDPDTMDTFVDSSWYHLRYTDAKNESEIFSKESMKRWLPVDIYIGGVEHATGHLLYFRFFTKFLKDIGNLDFDEPAARLYNHGMVLDKYGEVMSKSKGNVISPMEVVEKYGVDVCRISILFAAPAKFEMMWTDEGITGATRFLNRIYALYNNCKNLSATMTGGSASGGRDLKYHFKVSELSGQDLFVYRKLHWAIRKTEQEIDSLDMNTAIAGLMEFLNEFSALVPDKSVIYDYGLVNLAQLIAPFAPHLAEELWQKMGFSGSIFKSNWPVLDPEAVQIHSMTIPIQVNGKLRGTIEVPVEISEEELKKRVMSHERVLNFIKDKQIVKTIIVPKKLVNIVIR